MKKPSFKYSIQARFLVKVTEKQWCINLNVNIWDKVIRNRPSKTCGRQPLKNLTWSILKYFVRFIPLIIFLDHSFFITWSQGHTCQIYANSKDITLVDRWVSNVKYEVFTSLLVSAFIFLIAPSRRFMSGSGKWFLFAVRFTTILPSS